MRVLDDKHLRLIGRPGHARGRWPKSSPYNCTWRRGRPDCAYTACDAANTRRSTKHRPTKSNPKPLTPDVLFAVEHQIHSLHQSLEPQTSLATPEVGLQSNRCVGLLLRKTPAQTDIRQKTHTGQHKQSTQKYSSNANKNAKLKLKNICSLLKFAITLICSRLQN